MIEEVNRVKDRTEELKKQKVKERGKVHELLKKDGERNREGGEDARSSSDGSKNSDLTWQVVR